MISGVVLHCTCKRHAATLTRLLTQPTSSLEGEAELHLSPGGRGRARSARVRGETPRSQNSRVLKRRHVKGRAA